MALVLQTHNSVCSRLSQEETELSMVGLLGVDRMELSQ